MEYRHLGRAGIKVSELSYGAWMTFGKKVELSDVKDMMRCAFDQGVNFFDNAEAYAHGEAERLMGEALKDYHRDEVIVSTKIFWGAKNPDDEHANAKGHSRKRLIEGTKKSLQRLQLEHVDLLYCHRRDEGTSIEETVLTMDHLIRHGYALYWGTSEWSAEDILEAYQTAEKLNCIKPTMEQPQYNLFHRERLEKEYEPIFKKYGMGTTIWSPLASGMLTGKYNNGIPEDSRYKMADWLIPEDFDARVEKTKQLSSIASDLGCTVGQLAIAWCLHHPNVSTVILGASKREQLEENLKAIKVKNKLTDDVVKAIEHIVN